MREGQPSERTDHERTAFYRNYLLSRQRLWVCAAMPIEAASNVFQVLSLGGCINGAFGANFDVAQSTDNKTVWLNHRGQQPLNFGDLLFQRFSGARKRKIALARTRNFHIDTHASCSLIIPISCSSEKSKCCTVHLLPRIGLYQNLEEFVGLRLQ